MKILPEACKICIANASNSGKYNGISPRLEDNGGIISCYSGTTACLEKDRAIIVLLDKLLKK